MIEQMRQRMREESVIIKMIRPCERIPEGTRVQNRSKVEMKYADVSRLIEPDGTLYVHVLRPDYVGHGVVVADVELCQRDGCQYCELCNG